MMPRWLLPEAIEDVLPEQAGHIEQMRGNLLGIFRGYGYALVIPPLIEYVESLLTGIGDDLDLRTFKLVDQLSGRSLGLRADIAPQLARIDAHLLGREGVVRLCYCGSVVHTVPNGISSTREPLQIGAELYGHGGLEADIEVIRMLADGLQAVGLSASRIDVGHVGVFRALATRADLAPRSEAEVFMALQSKDVSALNSLTRGISEPLRSALLALPELYGSAAVLEQAERALAPVDSPDVMRALDELRRLAVALSDLPISFDLADLRGNQYHNGTAFAAYCAGSAGAIALGGRYDGVGKSYGRDRAATGFSMDLREIGRLVLPTAVRGAILAPWPEDDAVHTEANRLRSAGEVVVLCLPGHDGQWREAGCDRVLVKRGENWMVEPLKE
jgi:ATP phosphoribosyltransferase regulatory subunit